MFKFLTLNFWGKFGPFKERLQVLKTALDQLQPDVIFFQEFSDPQLIREFPDFPSSLIFPETGLAFFSKFEFSETQKITFHTQSPTEDYPRGMLWAKISYPRLEIALANTHLSWKPEEEPIRLAQMRELLDHGKRFPFPCILAGDFNDTAESAPLKLCLASHFIDVYRKINPNQQDITWDNRNPFIQTHKVKLPDRRIDFIVVNSDLPVDWEKSSCRIVCREPNAQNIFASDHYGVFAQLSLPNHSPHGLHSIIQKCHNTG